MDGIHDYVAHLATEKHHARSLISAGVNQLRDLNEDLATETTASGGVVLFGYNPKAYPGKAAALVSPERKLFNPFGEDHVRGRFVNLAATALGDEIMRLDKNPQSERLFVSSRLNTSEQMVWTHPIIIDGRIVTVAQAAFNSVRNNGIIGIGNQRIMDIFNHHQTSLAAVSRAVTEIPVENLELAPETTPNAYTVRWDIRESTRLATGKRQGAYLAYKQALIEGFNMLLQPFESAVVDAGDGQNIVVYLPTNPEKSISPSDITGIKVWGRENIAPLIQSMQKLQHSLASTLYPDLTTTIRLSVDLGHVIDTGGQLDSDGFSLTALQMKQRPTVPVTYTDRASFLERTN